MSEHSSIDGVGGWETGENGEPDSNQLQTADTLDDRGVGDVLDEGFVTRERWSPGQGFGNTPAEQRRGETLDQRLAQEEPEQDPYDAAARGDVAADPDDPEPESGVVRAGRLVAPDEGAHGDDEAMAWASDVGIDGAGASAEEAAMHVLPDPDL